MASFSSILDRPSSSIERPKPLPIGQYICMIQGQPRFDKSAKKGTDFVEFTLKFLSALESVDEDALNLALTSGDGTRKPLTDKTIKSTYYLTEDSTWRLVEFLDHAQAGDEDSTLAQRIDDTPNKEIGVTIVHTPSQDGTSIFANIGKTFEVE